MADQPGDGHDRGGGAEPGRILCQQAGQPESRHSRWILTSKLPLHGPDGTVIGIVGLGRDITALKHAELELRRARDELEVRVRDRTAELSKAITALQAEISRRETVESQLRETEEQYRTIFEQALDAIMVVDAETGRFVDFNDQACVQLGYERADFARLTLADIDAGNGADSFGQHIQRIFAIGSEVFETQHRTKSGAIRSVIVSSRPITLRGRPVLLAFFHDITDRKQIEDELRDAVVRLETHNKAKSEFVANVSHELKTPLTSMMYGTRNLLKGIAGPLPDKVVSYLKMFDTECQRLVGTINDILDLGKLDNRALTLSPVTAPLGRLVARSIDPLRLQADAAGLELDVSVSPEAAFVKCDPDMLQRVIQNLMSNATKFTPRAGKIRFTGGLAADHPGMVAIAVTDTGVGIPAEAITHIAERYFRAGSHASGSGLGLAISKEIVALHGGTFNVLSPPPGQSHGTQVTITIPVAPAPLVLVVDDDRAMQDLIARQLGPRGYRVESVDRGETALARIEAGHHDVVIMDLILEGISGADAILALKSSSAFRYVPILAVTGATINEATADILTRFSIPTLPKPWDDEALVDTIESVLLGKTAFQFSG
jgi:PAS domain S-box-containing protein